MTEREWHKDFPGYYYDPSFPGYRLDPDFKQYAKSFTSNTILIDTELPKVPRYGVDAKKQEKKQMFVIQTVKVKAGVIGQAYYEDRVVWESAPQVETTEGEIVTSAEGNARKAAQAAINAALDNVFKEIN